MYVLALFRLIGIYQRAVVGEWTAMAFTPLLILGLWEIYSKTNQKKAWIYVVAGSFGLMATHILSTIMVVVFVVIFMLLLIKRTFQKEVWVPILKVVLGALLVNAYFIVPFLDSYARNELITVDLGPIYEWSAYLRQIFSTRYQAYLNEVLNGMEMEMPISIGYASLFIALAAIYVVFKDKPQKNKAALSILLVLFGISIVASTNIFPYRWIYQNGSFLRTVCRVLQFPYRLLSVSTVLITAIAAILLGYARENGRKVLTILMIVMMTLSCVHGIRYVWGYATEQALADRVYDHDEGDSYDAASYGEYTLTNLGYVGVREPVLSDLNSMECSNYMKDGLKITADIVNYTEKEQYIDFPLQCYFGYKAYGEHGQLSLEKSEESKVRVRIPAGYEGSIRVEFETPFYWDAAWIVSIVSVVGLGMELKRRNKEV